MASNRSLKPLVSARVVLARDLQQQLFELVQAAQPMAGDGIRQARAQHDELVLALVFRRTHGAADGAVKPAQLALGSGIHVAHAADDAVRLVVQIQTVGDQLLEIDFGRTIGTAAVRGRAAITAPVAAASPPPRSPPRPAASAVSLAPGRPFAAAAASSIPFWFLSCGMPKPRLTAAPIRARPARRTQFHVGGFAAHHLVDQVGPQFLKFAVPRAAQNAIEAALEAPCALCRRILVVPGVPYASLR